MVRQLVLLLSVITCVPPIYLIGWVIYNLFFHPLRSYPGPRSWAATRFPLDRSLTSGNGAFDATRLHKKYGDVVRIGPNQLSYINASALKDVYGHRQGHEEFSKDKYANVLPVNGVLGIVAANRENHSRYRRLFSHAFSEKGLREQETLIRGYVDLLIQRLHEYSTKGAQDMIEWYSWTTFDLIGDLAFGESFHCLERTQTHPWMHFVFENVKAIPFIGVVRRYGLLPLVQFIVPKKLMQARIENYEFTRDKVIQRVKLGKDRGDFFDTVLKQEYPKGMTVEEMTSNASVLVVAGSETSATALSGATYLILKHPRVLEKLIAEIRGAFESDGDLNFINTGQLKYLSAVLDESLRMYPPLPIGNQRVVPKGGDTIMGKLIPADVSIPNNPCATLTFGNIPANHSVHNPQTVISNPQYASYRAPTNFHQPDSFIPERHLPDHDAVFDNDNRAVLQPFAIGPRNCIGRNLANVEMRFILAKVLFNFDLELEDDRCGDWLVQKVYALWEKHPLWVKLKSRS